MKKTEPLAFSDAVKLTAAQMNAIHLETGQHSDAIENHQLQRRHP